mgnify:FL=1
MNEFSSSIDLETREQAERLEPPYRVMRIPAVIPAGATLHLYRTVERERVISEWKLLFGEIYIFSEKTEESKEGYETETIAWPRPGAEIAAYNWSRSGKLLHADETTLFLSRWQSRGQQRDIYIRCLEAAGRLIMAE